MQRSVEEMAHLLLLMFACDGMVWFWCETSPKAALVSSSVGTPTGTIGVTDPDSSLPLTTGTVVANALGVPTILDCNIGAA